MMSQHHLMLLNDTDDNYNKWGQRKTSQLLYKSFVFTIVMILVLILMIIVFGSKPSISPPRISINNCSSDYNFDYYELALRWPASECFEKSCLKYTDMWCIHGMWPTLWNNHWPQDCCFERTFNVKNLEPIVSQLEKCWQNLMPDQTYDSLWRHEWMKHGTCTKMHQFNYFNKALDLYNSFAVGKWLTDHSIVASNDVTYSLKSIHDAIDESFGHKVQLKCIHVNEYSLIDQILICLDKTSFSPIDCIQADSCRSGPVLLPKTKS